MKLLDSLYTIGSDTITQSGREFVICLNPEHFIYKAHFPGEPITPGVCIMQIAEELLELDCGSHLVLEKVKNVKFLKIITPGGTPSIRFTIRKKNIEGETVSAQVEADWEEDIYAKLSLACRTM